MRVMPNTPCLVGETASAMCLGGNASEEDAEEVRTLFSSVGRIVQVGSTPFAGVSQVLKASAEDQDCLASGTELMGYAKSTN